MLEFLGKLQSLYGLTADSKALGDSLSTNAQERL